MFDSAYRNTIASAMSSLNVTDSYVSEMIKASNWRDDIERALGPTLAFQNQIQKVKNSLNATIHSSVDCS